MWVVVYRLHCTSTIFFFTSQVHQHVYLANCISKGAEKGQEPSSASYYAEVLVILDAVEVTKLPQTRWQKGKYDTGFQPTRA